MTGRRGSPFSTSSLEGDKETVSKIKWRKDSADHVSHRGPAGRNCTGNQLNLKRSLGPGVQEVSSAKGRGDGC